MKEALLAPSWNRFEVYGAIAIITGFSAAIYEDKPPALCLLVLAIAAVVLGILSAALQDRYLDG